MTLELIRHRGDHCHHWYVLTQGGHEVIDILRYYLFLYKCYLLRNICMNFDRFNLNLKFLPNYLAMKFRNVNKAANYQTLPESMLTYHQGSPLALTLRKCYRKWVRYPLLQCNVLNSLWPSDAIWCHRTWSTLAQVMACSLTA